MEKNHKVKKFKHCRDCERTKRVSEFSDRTGYQIGMKLAFCKACMQERTEEWVRKNRGRNNDYQREYRREHPQIYYKRKK